MSESIGPFSVRPNRLKSKPPGSPRPFVLLDILSPDLLEIYGMLGAECFMIEGEHAAYDETLFLHLVRVGELYDMTPGIRVNTLDRGQIARLLDIGIQWIHYAHAESAEDVERFVRYAKYPPIGERGFGRFSRLNRYGMADEAEAIKAGNDSVYLSVAIEDLEGVRNVREICEVEHIDSVEVGSSDLTASMGLPGQYDHPKVQEVLQSLVDTMKEFPHARPPGRGGYAIRAEAVGGVPRPSGPSGYTIATLLRERLTRGG
jgi:4-hydroxy-2-oxoheptanedioate aldolase